MSGREVDGAGEARLGTGPSDGVGSGCHAEPHRTEQVLASTQARCQSPGEGVAGARSVDDRHGLGRVPAPRHHPGPPSPLRPPAS